LVSSSGSRKQASNAPRNCRAVALCTSALGLPAAVRCIPNSGWTPYALPSCAASPRRSAYGDKRELLLSTRFQSERYVPRLRPRPDTLRTQPEMYQQANPRKKKALQRDRATLLWNRYNLSIAHISEEILVLNGFFLMFHTGRAGRASSEPFGPSCSLMSDNRYSVTNAELQQLATTPRQTWPSLHPDYGTEFLDCFSALFESSTFVGR